MARVRRVQTIRAVVRLLVALMRALVVDLDWQWLPDGEANSGLLPATDRAKSGRFLNTLDSVDSVRKRAAFYVEEHNLRLPHSALRGQTPDEMYFGTGEGVPDDLERQRAVAK